MKVVAMVVYLTTQIQFTDGTGSSSWTPLTGKTVEQCRREAAKMRSEYLRKNEQIGKSTILSYKSFCEVSR